MANKKISQLNPATNPEVALDKEIAIVVGGATKRATLAQIKAAFGIAETFLLPITATGTDTYVHASLVNKSILSVTTDTGVRIPSDYTFTSVTGTIQFTSNITTGTIIQIIYK